MRFPESGLPLEAQHSRPANRQARQSCLSNVCRAPVLLTQLVKLNSVTGMALQIAGKLGSDILFSGPPGTEIHFLQKGEIGLAPLEMFGNASEIRAVIDVPGHHPNGLQMRIGLTSGHLASRIWNSAGRSSFRSEPFWTSTITNRNAEASRKSFTTGWKLGGVRTAHSML